RHGRRAPLAAFNSGDGAFSEEFAASERAGTYPLTSANAGDPYETLGDSYRRVIRSVKETIGSSCPWREDAAARAINPPHSSRGSADRQPKEKIMNKSANFAFAVVRKIFGRSDAANKRHCSCAQRHASGPFRDIDILALIDVELGEPTERWRQRTHS